MDWTEEQLDTIRQAQEKAFPFIENCQITIPKLEKGYCRMEMPLAPNINHVGIMYAGALYTIAEAPAGPLSVISFDIKRFYPIVKNMSIRFRRPAATDVYVDVRISDEEIARIEKETEENGKCDFEWDVEVKDANDVVVAITHNVYQLRKIGT